MIFKKEYVRNIYRVLNIEPSIELKTELQKINPDYFVHWERLHSSCIGSKEASDLVVCYLSDSVKSVAVSANIRNSLIFVPSFFCLRAFSKPT